MNDTETRCLITWKHMDRQQMDRMQIDRGHSYAPQAGLGQGLTNSQCARSKYIKNFVD